MSVYVTGIPTAEDTFSHLADGVTLDDDDIVICLGDAQLADHSDLSKARLDSLGNLGCEVAVLRGANERRYWKELIKAGQGEPLFDLWCGNWSLSLPDYPQIHFLPDAGGFFDMMGLIVLMLPSAMIGPDFSFYGQKPMLDLAVADKMWALTTEIDGCYPSLVMSYSQPSPSSDEPDEEFMAEMREMGGISDVTWLYSAGHEPVQPNSVYCPGDCLHLIC